MKSYVINLAARPERLDHIRRTFGRAGIAFERFDAVDQERAAIHPLARRLPPLRSGRGWQPFELGCLLSHYELWQKIAGGNEDFAAIFEDDVLVSEHLAAILQGDFPRSADLIKLETVLQVVYLDNEELRASNDSVGFRLLRSIHEGTGAYIVSRRAAKALSAITTTIDEPLDWALFSPKLAQAERLVVYQTVPAVAIQGILIPELRDTPIMKSDRAPVQSQSRNIFSRIVRRLLCQLRWTRAVVPFAGSATAG